MRAGKHIRHGRVAVEEDIMADFQLTDEQAAIVHADVDKTMIIVAGAGSGKTFTMTERIIELIAYGVQPQKILGLTFTKAAATELLTRVASAVAQQRESKQQENKKRENKKRQNAADMYADEELLSDSRADNAFMKPEVYTYDAFFQSIVRQYGLLVGFDPNTVPLSSAGAYQLAESVVRDHFRQAVKDMHHGDDADESGVSSASTDDMSDVGNYSTFVARIVSLSDAMSSCMIDQTCTTMDEAIDRVERWDSEFIRHLDEIIERDYPQERKLPDFGTPVSLTKAATQDKFDKWKNEHSRDYAAGVLMEMREQTRLRSVYARYVRLFAERKRELRLAQFSDFTIAAMQLVQRFPWIGEQYRARFSHVFLDEYQDSSTAQASLIVQLFAPQGVQDKQNSSALTAVGDPYQAIYAWRGAAPGAFVSFVRATGSDAPMSLSKTVRNPEIVLDMANALTNPLRQERHDAYGRTGTVKLSEVSVQRLTNLAHSSVGSIAAVAYATMRQEIDGAVRYAKEAIARSKEENDMRIAMGKKAQPGPHVAVLLRSKTNMGQFAQAFTDEGLTVQVDGTDSVMDRPDTHDMLNVLHIVSDHTDSAAVLNLLASPRCGISASDLQNFAQAVTQHNASLHRNLLSDVGMSAPERGTWSMPPVVSLADILLGSERTRERVLDTYYHGSPEGREQIEECARLLARVDRVMTADLETIIRTAADALGLDIDVAVAYAMTHAQELVGKALPISSEDALVDMAHTYTTELSQGQKPTVAGFLAWAEMDSSSAPSNPTIVGSANADVMICTIHHSKGLEWDSVIIPQLNQGTSPSNQGTNFGVSSFKDNDPIKQGEYLSHARTWLTDPTDVPHPVRVDRDAVSYFADVDEFDSFIPTALALEEKVNGQLEGPEPDVERTVMSLREETGQSIIEDERRLMYVAVTRAKRDVLMTTSVRKNSDATDNFNPVKFIDEEMRHTLLANPPRPSLAKASIYFQEAFEYLQSKQFIERFGEETLVDVVDEWGDEELVDAPIGFFAGEFSWRYAKATIGSALADSEKAQEQLSYTIYQHPRFLDPRVGVPLYLSSRIVRTESGEHGPLREAAERVHQAMQELGFAHAPLRDGHADSTESSSADAELIESARNIQTQRNTSVTTIQREYSDDESDHAKIIRARAILRPVPNIVNYTDSSELSAAHMGTVFHAFAERYFKPDDAEMGNQAGDEDSEYANSRESIRREVADEQPQNSHDKTMHVWKERLIASSFNPWDCVGTEVPFAYAPETTDHTIVGVIDAVFAGEQLHDSPIATHARENGRTIRYTVIDWKTGYRPTDPHDIEKKLLQIDMYRDIVAMLRGVDVDDVDAALYYVSEEDESKRTIPAQYKTREEIENILSGFNGERLEDRND